MKLKIRTAERRTVEVSVEPKTLVSKLKSLIWEKSAAAIRPCQQELLCAGRIMKNSEPVESYVLKEGATVYVIKRRFPNSVALETTADSSLPSTADTNSQTTAANQEGTIGATSQKKPDTPCHTANLNYRQICLQSDFDSPERTLRLFFNGLMPKLVNLRIAQNHMIQRAINTLFTDYRFKIFVHMYRHRPNVIQRCLDVISESSFTLRRVTAKYQEEVLDYINHCPYDEHLRPEGFISSLTEKDLSELDRLNSVGISSDIIIQIYYVLHKNEQRTLMILKRLISTAK